jgi:hypothetical protein
MLEYIKNVLKKVSFDESLFKGEMAEWSNAVVLKTIVPRGTGGSNPSLSATILSKLAWE